ncbi:PIG-L family deacetylase, partial [Mycobacterium tuberculosis]|nr:PIG-L family deacetylase [Mycobacterium tuberculosis]
MDLWKAIKPLTTIASAMNTGAHPDDEHSAMLAYLSLGQGVDTYSVIANRGEGGQNEIGSELDNALGIIRTRELQEASKVTNVHLEMLSQKINDPIYDFG